MSVAAEARFIREELGVAPGVTHGRAGGGLIVLGLYWPMLILRGLGYVLHPVAPPLNGCFLVVALEAAGSNPVSHPRSFP